MNFKKKRIFGMIHLSGNESNIVERALTEIDIYIEEGLDGCIIENYHGGIRDVINVLKALKNKKIKEGFELGINILPNEYHEAIQLANLYGCSFIQLDFVAGKYERTSDFDVQSFLTLINQYPKIFVMGGVWPKYYIPVGTSVLANDLLDASDLANAIVVTGSGTGKETPLEKIMTFKMLIDAQYDCCNKTPLIIGAGLDATNVVEQLMFADGAIVGSSFKPYKRTQEMVSRELVKEFMNEVKKINNVFTFKG